QPVCRGRDLTWICFERCLGRRARTLLNSGPAAIPQSDRRNLAHGWLPVPGDSTEHQLGTSMPQGGHPPHHSITSSARASTVGEISSRRALATIRLTTSSNLTGCSTGISPVCVPETQTRT